MLQRCCDLLALVRALNHQQWFLVDGTVCEGTGTKWEERILKCGGQWYLKKFQHFGPIFVHNRIRPSRFEPVLSAPLDQAFPKISQNFVRTVIRHIRIFIKFLSAQGSGIWREFPRSSHSTHNHTQPFHSSTNHSLHCRLRKKTLYSMFIYTCVVSIIWKIFE